MAENCGIFWYYAWICSLWFTVRWTLFLSPFCSKTIMATRPRTSPLDSACWILSDSTVVHSRWPLKAVKFEFLWIFAQIFILGTTVRWDFGFLSFGSNHIPSDCYSFIFNACYSCQKRSNYIPHRCFQRSQISNLCKKTFIRGTIFFQDQPDILNHSCEVSFINCITQLFINTMNKIVHQKVILFLHEQPNEHQ